MLDEIVRLTLDDLPGCLELAEDRAWLPEEHKWRLLFAVGTVFGVRDDAGELVGVAILTRFGADLAAISMVLVATRYGGQGIGRRLMTHALAAAGDAVVFLNATESGHPLYEKLGFVAVGTTYTYVGTFTSSGEPAGSRLAIASDLSTILAVDTQAFGAERRSIIERLPAFTEHLRVIEHDGIITGYAGAWRNVDIVMVGPVIAETPDDAKVLIADVSAHFREPVRLDLDDRHPQLHEWAERHGFALRSSNTVMVHNRRALPGQRDRWFMPLMQALG